MPIYLDAGTATGIVVKLLTPSEQLTPYYTWKVISKSTKETYNFYANNYSTSPYFLSFTISNMTGSATAGYIPLKGGEYRYEVYEKLEPYNLLITATDSMLGTGILVVEGTYSNVNIYTQSSDQVIYTYHNF